MSLRQGHELDAELAGANLFGWFGPAIGLLIRNLPIVLGGGAAAVLGQYLVDRLPWPLFERGWIAVLHGVVDGIVYSLVTVAAYRMLAWKESKETALDVNSLSRSLILGFQVYVVWTILVLVCVGILVLIGSLLAGLMVSLVGGTGLFALLIYGALGMPILLFLFSPLWAILGVASALSTAHAVRVDEHGAEAVFRSLSLAFGQKWRVFWPSYAIGLLVIGLYALFLYLLLDGSLLYLQFLPSFRYAVAALPAVAVAFGLALTFVVERAYAPDLGLAPDRGNGEAAPRSSMGADPSTAANSAVPAAQASVASAAAPAGAAAPAPATPSEIAAMIDKDLRSNQTRRLVELTERGLAADARFFLVHPDSTITLAKKLGQLERADLAVKVLNPFLKDHGGHRLHLTAALLAANLLGKDRKRLPEVARFLERVKALYPTEPMVDQLIKATAKAIAAGGVQPSASDEPQGA